MKLIEKHKLLNRPIILDGAMGSLLQQKGLIANDVIWSARANIVHPEIVKSIHKEYIEAGSEIITTNTFRTNPISLAQSGFNFNKKEIVSRSVEIAILAADGKDIIIAGSNAPAEDCYQIERKISKKELEQNHFDHIGYLIDAGVDIIWNETFSHLDEIKIIIDICESMNFPYAINLFFTDDLKILSGENLARVIDFIIDHSPTLIGFNCVTPQLFLSLMEHFDIDKYWGFYLNCGSGNYSDSKITTGINAEQYSAEIKKHLHLNPTFIGACCGSTPAHIKKIKDTILDIYSN